MVNFYGSRQTEAPTGVAVAVPMKQTGRRRRGGVDGAAGVALSVDVLSCLCGRDYVMAGLRT